MRKFWLSLLFLGIAVTAFAGETQAIAAAAAQDEVVLKVLDPRAQFWGPQAQKLCPRLDTLDGKKIALVNNGKAGGDHMIGPMLEVLSARYPKTEFKKFKVSFFDYAKKEEDMKAVAEWADGVVEMLGD